MSSKPLSGLRILDLTRLLPGPLCAQHLADLGADVIKIEDTMAGDYARYTPPLHNNSSTLFHALNRNKRSLTLDFTRENGKRIFLKLAERADILMESFRPGVMKKFGLDYEEVKKVNPNIIYCSITGYGQSGPNKNRAGHDLNFVAESGALHTTGRPAIPRFQTGDIAGGTLTAAMAILAAIVQRSLTGEGQFIDVSIFDSLLAHSVFGLSQINSKELLGADTSGLLSGDAHYYNLYETKDHRFVALAAIEYKFWERFCAAAQKPEWLSRHICMGEDAHTMKTELTDFFKTKTLSEWNTVFHHADCCVSPVATLEEALESEQVKQRGTFISEKNGGGNRFAFPALFSNMKLSAEGPAPAYGEQTAEILEEIGIGKEELEQLRKEKTVL